MFVERKRFLANEGYLVGKMLTKRARKFGLIGRTERVLCMLNFVLDLDRDIKVMPVTSYFSVKRFQRAGIDPRNVRTRILNACRALHRFPGEAPRPIYYVGDLLIVGRANFLTVSNVGEKCADIIQKLFERDGITGF